VFKRLVIIALLLAGAASADVVTFNDRTQWSAFVSNVTNTDFGTLMVPGETRGFTFIASENAVVTLGAATYRAGSVYIDPDGNVHPNSFAFIVTPQYCDGCLSPGNYATLLTSSEYNWGGLESYSGGLGIQFNPGFTAIGFDLTSVLSPGTFTITLSTGDSFQITTGPDSSVFFGVVSGTPITGMYISQYSDAGAFGLGNVSYGQGEVPEPATLVLFMTGLASMAGLRKRLLRAA
jgi:hypothetical protein